MIDGDGVSQVYILVLGGQQGGHFAKLFMDFSILFPYQKQILPQYMNDAGYESHMVGKWHLGSYNYESLPTHRGFETYLGYLNGEDNYWTHKVKKGRALIF